MSTCFYCGKPVLKSTEHVFPKGLGGGRVYVDFVCQDCNIKFSTFERDLMQTSPVGLIRSIEGVEGYRKNKKRIAPLKNSSNLVKDIKNNIYYEFGQEKGMKPYFRTQILKIGSEFYFDSVDREEKDLLLLKFRKWQSECLTIITEIKKSKEFYHKAVKFSESERNVTYENLEIPKIKNEIILKIEKDKKFIDCLPSRLYIDDDNKLFIRAVSITEGREFVIGLLKFIKENKVIHSSKPDFSKDFVVNVSLSFNFKNVERALVKIGLNCLLYNYPELKDNIALKEYKKFVNTGTGLKGIISQKLEVEVKKNESHYVLFSQQKEHLVVRINLFDNSFIYFFVLQNIEIMIPRQFTAYQINYETNKNTFHSSSTEVVENLMY